jgi:hypothetical protein
VRPWLVVILGGLHLALFVYNYAAFAAGGAACKVYCGPGTLLTADALLLAAAAAWVAALAASVANLVAGSARVVSVVCLATLLIPIIVAAVAGVNAGTGL